MTPEERPPIAPLLEYYGMEYCPESPRWKAVKCPFHEDRNASASVSTGLQRFRCFACQINSEDAFGLVIWKGDASDFPGAVEFLQRILGEGYKPVQQGSKGVRRGPRRPGLSEEPSIARNQRTVFQARVRRKPFTGT